MTDPNTPRHGLESLLSSLPGNQSVNGGVNVRILPQAGHINLRGNPENHDFAALVSETLGQALPLGANTMSIGAYRVYWLAPGEWLIVTPLADRQERLHRLRTALPGQKATVTDISGGQVVLNISGPGTRRLLAKGCTLNLQADKFKIFGCAQSGLANVNILIGLLDEQATFELIVRRSFAEYLVLWLRHSGAEYGINFC